jgi:LysM repeat protein
MRKLLAIAFLSMTVTVLAVSPVGADSGIVHVVQWGESLSSIAAHYGVTTQAIVAANGLADPDFVFVGQRLTIPGSGYYGGQQYSVQPGDTLASIAWKFGTTVKALISVNRISDADVIYVGQVLAIPGASDGYDYPATKACSYYTVKAGDTMSVIAVRHGSTINALAQTNGLSNPGYIYVGQRLCVPPGGYAGYQQMGTTYYHLVKPGDTLSGIAWHYGVSLASIVKANNLSNASLILVGQKLVVPGGAGIPQKAYKPSTGTGSAAAPAPPYKPDAVPQRTAPSPYTGPLFVVKPVQVWRGSQTADGWDPRGLTTLIVITGDQPGTRVRLSSDSLQTAIDSGHFPEFGDPVAVFQGIPGGIYQVTLEGENAEPARAKVDPGARVYVEFKKVIGSPEPTTRAPTGWTGRIASNTSGYAPANGVWSILTVRGPAAGLPIILTSEGGGFQATCLLGTKPEFGPAACQFGGLWPGHYIAQVDGAGIGVEIYLDGVGNAEIEFSAN